MAILDNLLIFIRAKAPERYQSERCDIYQLFHRSVPNGDWSDCLLLEEGKSSSVSKVQASSPFCGIGKRYRRLDCLDMSNQLAEPM